MSLSAKKKRNDSLILIADDVPKNIQLLGKILDNNGYDVVAVTSGKQVVNAARKHKPNLILLDIMMPEMNGYEVCQELKQDSELAVTPVIFLTARTEEEDIIKGLTLGGADYITKPFNSRELLARVDTHVSLKKARDQIVHQKEKLEQLTETKDKLYSIIAHDLRGALFGISGLSEIVVEEINEKPMDEEIKNMIELISNSASSATMILTNLLAWTNLQTGKLELNPEKFSLFELINETTRLFKVQARQKKVMIKVESEDNELMVYADRQMIFTVIRNLVSNALKFSENGDQITIRASKSNNMLQLVVHDEGKGMDDETINNLFDPENRPQRVGTSGENGTGLGLLMCKEFLNAHDGEIHVESKLGEGSEFSFKLPAKIPEHHQSLKYKIEV